MFFKQGYDEIEHMVDCNLVSPQVCVDLICLNKVLKRNIWYRCNSAFPRPRVGEPRGRDGVLGLSHHGTPSVSLLSQLTRRN